ncbi:epimerase [Herbaspirillum frisingense]|uniref:epimerase n=1 Tax=Herbaspirillum frisingense TaxID=92645 RepID=UPI001600E5B3|nr:epimerase [Herbaspirillum frisingense]QNB05864.1 epimerase [Herbaspirillum frisingense]
MNVIIFGASGMVGQAVLLCALHAPDVDNVIVVVRTALTLSHPKLRQLVEPDPASSNLDALAVGSVDVCFYCIGVSAAGLDERRYSALTRDTTVKVARRLLAHHPALRFVYVSAHGADSSESGKVMWARVRGATENALGRLPFSGLSIVRPALIQPLDGIRSKTRSYRWFYWVASPLISLTRWLIPRHVLTTRLLGEAMLAVAREPHGAGILEPRDILRRAQGGSIDRRNNVYKR